jgi:abequosyltransferase
MKCNEPTKLSICIATFNRGQFIGETLDSILTQVVKGVEIVVVDGASPDDTSEVMARYAAAHKEIRYFRESFNSGVDVDFDKAVGYATGEFCWLMSDDDLLKAGAIVKVLDALNGDRDLVIVNSEVRNVDLTEVLETRRLAYDTVKTYRAEDREALFEETASYLSFIGCVVIRRLRWLTRDRSSYYGSLFIHVGVIFQSPPISDVQVIAEPLITIRYGNAMWTSRSFEVWMFKWPQLVWSFPDFSDSSKRKVCRREPWRSAKALFHNRALGAYTTAVFRKFWPAKAGMLDLTIAYALSVFPASLANMVMVLYFSTVARPSHMALYDLLFSRNASVLSRLVVRVLGAKRY